MIIAQILSIGFVICASILSIGVICKLNRIGQDSSDVEIEVQKTEQLRLQCNDRMSEREHRIKLLS
jgi:hypothetical protein